jgi:hypothetical protein
MKYLKTYKIFETLTTEVKSDIDNILLDLNDEGIHTKCEVFRNAVDEEEFKFMYLIKIHKKRGASEKMVRWDDVKDTIKRIDKYVDSCEGTSLDIEIDDGEEIVFFTTRQHDSEEINSESLTNGEFFTLEIRFFI